MISALRFDKPGKVWQFEIEKENLDYVLIFEVA